MEPEHLNRISCDVLVIGSGGAGLKAAIEAAKNQCKVTLVSKSRVGYGNNTAIGGGGMASTGWGPPEDSPDVHFKDTVVSGRYINNQRLAEVMVNNSEREVRELAGYGVDFLKSGDKFAVRLTPGHSYPRTLSVTRRVGAGYTLPLRSYAEKVGVNFIENVLVTGLLIDSGRVAGAVGVDRTGQIVAFECKSAVVAGGGCGQAYLRTNNAAGITGDGYALLYRAGAPLQDMEFVQFYPTALGVAGSTFILYEWMVAQDGAPIKNSLGEDVVEKYGLRDKKMMTRDRLAQAIMREILEGRSIDGFLSLDLSVLPQDIIERRRATLPRCNIEARVYPVAPTVHFFMGGAVIDENCRTGIEGLYAAGEVCCTVHGANRLGSNAFADIFVFGSIAGRNAAREASTSGTFSIKQSLIDAEIDRIRNLASNRGKKDLYELRKSLKECMWRDAGIIRSEGRLCGAVTELKIIQSDIENITVNSPGDLLKALELQNMLAVSEIICRSALLRTESRGSHYRSDFPQEDNNKWLKNMRVINKNGDLVFSVHKVDLYKISYSTRI